MPTLCCPAGVHDTVDHEPIPVVELDFTGLSDCRVIGINVCVLEPVFVEVVVVVI